MQTKLHKTVFKSSHMDHSILKLLIVAAITGLVGCQVTPPKPLPRQTINHHNHPIVVVRPAAPYNPTTPQPEFGYPSLVSQAIPVLPTPAQPQVVLRDGHNIPLVQKLMAQGFKQLQLGQLDNAEETYVQVQRIAPQYSSVYARLSQVALKRKDGATAEVMARRGLVLTRSPQQKQGFWQLIALAGAMQNKSDVVNEANGHLRGQ
jgi:hypothetical protein